MVSKMVSNLTAVESDPNGIRLGGPLYVLTHFLSTEIPNEVQLAPLTLMMNRISFGLGSSCQLTKY